MKEDTLNMVAVERIRTHLDELQNGVPLRGMLLLLNPPTEPEGIISGHADDITNPDWLIKCAREVGHAVGSCVGRLFNDGQTSQEQLHAMKHALKDLSHAFEMGIYNSLQNHISHDSKLQLQRAQTIMRVKAGGIITRPN